MPPGRKKYGPEGKYKKVDVFTMPVEGKRHSASPADLVPGTELIRRGQHHVRANDPAKKKRTGAEVCSSSCGKKYWEKERTARRCTRKKKQPLAGTRSHRGEMRSQKKKKKGDPPHVWPAARKKKGGHVQPVTRTSINETQSRGGGRGLRGAGS